MVARVLAKSVLERTGLLDGTYVRGTMPEVDGRRIRR
jgi:hypothetical protein